MRGQCEQHLSERRRDAMCCLRSSEYQPTAFHVTAFLPGSIAPSPCLALETVCPTETRRFWLFSPLPALQRWAYRVPAFRCLADPSHVQTCEKRLSGIRRARVQGHVRTCSQIPCRLLGPSDNLSAGPSVVCTRVELQKADLVLPPKLLVPVLGNLSQKQGTGLATKQLQGVGLSGLP